jgi:hypothetical protein
MPTSNSYDWSATRADIIQGALRKIGALGDWETPTNEQVTVSAAALQALIKAWQADGMQVWVMKEQTIGSTNLASGSVNIGIGQTVNIAKPLKVTQAFLRRGDIDTPLDIWDRHNYNTLINHGITGTPTIVYYQPLVDYGVLKCYPRPDAATQAATSVVIHYQAMYDDMDSDSNTLALPPEWTEAVIYGLAVRLAPEYGLSINERQQLKLEAREFKEIALGFGTEEGSLYIQPG